MLLMFNHNSEPLLKVLLHPNSTSFKQILDPLDFCFQIFQFIVLLLIGMFQFVYLNLKHVLLFGPYDFTIIVNHASEGVLFANLFDLVCEIFDLGPCCIDTLAKLFSSSILFFEKSSILLHSLILTVTFPEHFK